MLRIFRAARPENGFSGRRPGFFGAGFRLFRGAVDVPGQNFN